MTRGEQVRDFMNVVDVALAFLHEAQALEAMVPVVRVKNLGSCKPQSIRQFAEHWWTQWNASGKLLLGTLPYRQGEVMRYVPEV
jgi:UDP-glucose 4-epimerase